jgi:hypothetical protein
MKEKEKTVSRAILMETDPYPNIPDKLFSRRSAELLSPVRTLLIPRLRRGTFIGKSYFWQHFIL